MNDTYKQAVYENAIFECLMCHQHFQLTLMEVRALLNPFHVIHCPYCSAKLALQAESRLLLIKRFKRMIKLTQLLVGFVLCYVFISAVIVWGYGGIPGASCLLVGFVVLIWIRRRLNKPIINDSCYLEAIKEQPLS